MTKVPLFVTTCAAAVMGCANGPRHGQTSAVSQEAFFPDAFTYKVGDFVLSLPVGYYEVTMQRLAFANVILENGSPKPVLEQERYLVLPEDGLAPKREFFVLDQHHLLIFDHYFELERGYPPRLVVLRRKDASWTDISKSVLPAWAGEPSEVRIESATGLIHVSSSLHPKRATFRWQGGRFTERE